MALRAVDPDLRTERLAVSLARSIEREIIALGWPVGTVLGSEPELVARFGVSRGVLREAIRLLEKHPVARIQLGRRAGLLVTAATSSSVTTALAIYFEFTK